MKRKRKKDPGEAAERYATLIGVLLLLALVAAKVIQEMLIYYWAK